MAIDGGIDRKALRNVIPRAEQVLRKRAPWRNLFAEWEYLLVVAGSTNTHVIGEAHASANATARRRALNEVELDLRHVADGVADDLPVLVDLFEERYQIHLRVHIEQAASPWSEMSTLLVTTGAKSRFCTPSILPDSELVPMPTGYETSLSDRELGSGTDGNGVYGKVEQRLADVHVADLAFPFIDGSTGAIRAIAEWIATWWVAPCVGVNRIAHKAVIHALDAYEVDWYYLDEPEVAPEFDAVAPIDPTCIAGAIAAENTDKGRVTTHVWVNSVTYEGVIAPLAQIAGVLATVDPPPVFVVDEAWGAHLCFDPLLKPLRALEHGADVVTFSTHKAGGARQGTAVLAAKSTGRCDLDQLLATVRGTITTSPSFPLVASIEAATNILDEHGTNRIAISRRLAVKLAEGLAASRLAVHPDDGGDIRSSVVGVGREVDPLKVAVRLADRSGFEVATSFDRHRVVVEKDGFRSVLFLVPFQVDDVDVAIAVQAALALVDEGPPAPEPEDPAPMPGPPPRFVNAKGNGRSRPDADLRARAERRPLDEALHGWVAVDVVAAYPPGVPVIVPGDRITPEQVAYLGAVQRGGGHVASGAGADAVGKPLVFAALMEVEER